MEQAVVNVTKETLAAAMAGDTGKLILGIGILVGSGLTLGVQQGVKLYTDHKFKKKVKKVVEEVERKYEEEAKENAEDKKKK